MFALCNGETYWLEDKEGIPDDPKTERRIVSKNRIMSTHTYNGFKIVDKGFKTLIILLLVIIAAVGLVTGFSHNILPALIILIAAALLADIMWIGVRH